MKRWQTFNTVALLVVLAMTA
ncbi:MAG: hypothetical protein RIR86_187, partial [Acidobacteriota bacterium]